MATNSCCAECGREEGGVSLKICGACMRAKYCNAACQRNHWAKHKIECKQRAAELRDEALFKDPPPKDDCPICFLPMPMRLICCTSLPPATILSVPIHNFAIANVQLAKEGMEVYFPCCGKNICEGCVHSFRMSGNLRKCPFCKSDRVGVTEEEHDAEIRKRVEANDPASIALLANYYDHGCNGLHQDTAKSIELYIKAAELGFSKAHNHLGMLYYDGGDLKKAKFHLEAAAMAGDDEARCKVGYMEHVSGNMDRALKHCTIAASAGCYISMHHLIASFKSGHISRDAMNSILTAYNNSCAEMRSEARDSRIRAVTETM